MKYSQLTGIVCSFLMIAICYMPWSFVPGINITLSGMNGYVSSQLTFGRQVIPHSFFALLLTLFFLLPMIWAKRVNVFIAAINLALSIKNFILFSYCRDGICPERQAGIYLLVLVSAIIQTMTFFPNIRVKKE